MTEEIKELKKSKVKPDDDQEEDKPIDEPSTKDNEESKDGAARGEVGIEAPSDENYCMVMCNRAGTGIAADTSLVSDLAKGFERAYDRSTLQVQFPQAFTHVIAKDAKMQVSASMNLMPCLLKHKRNVVSEGIGVVFISPTLYGPKGRNLDPIKYDNAISRGAMYADFFRNVLKLKTSVIQEPALEGAE